MIWSRLPNPEPWQHTATYYVVYWAVKSELLTCLPEFNAPPTTPKKCVAAPIISKWLWPVWSWARTDRKVGLSLYIAHCDGSASWSHYAMRTYGGVEERHDLYTRRRLTLLVVYSWHRASEGQFWFNSISGAFSLFPSCRCHCYFASWFNHGHKLPALVNIGWLCESTVCFKSCVLNSRSVMKFFVVIDFKKALRHCGLIFMLEIIPHLFSLSIWSCHMQH
jgi:hypothetical protein